MRGGSLTQRAQMTANVGRDKHDGNEIALEHLLSLGGDAQQRRVYLSGIGRYRAITSTAEQVVFYQRVERQHVQRLAVWTEAVANARGQALPYHFGKAA